MAFRNASNSVGIVCNKAIVQGGPSAETVGLGRLGFAMFHHLAWAVGSYDSGPPAGGTLQIQGNPTQLSQQMDSHTLVGF